MKIWTLWLVDLLGLLLQNLSDKAFFFNMKLTNQAHLLTWFFLKFAVIDVATTALINWKFAQHIIQNSKIFFFITLYRTNQKECFRQHSTRAGVQNDAGLIWKKIGIYCKTFSCCMYSFVIWHQKNKEKYPKSKYMLYI